MAQGKKSEQVSSKKRLGMRECPSMRIAFVYDGIYPYSVGGAEKRIWELAKRLVSNGHEIHLFGMKYWKGEDVIIRDGVYLHGVCKPKKLYVNGRRSIKGAIYFACRVLFPLLKEDVDLVECTEFPYFPIFSAKIYSLIKRRPLVVVWLEVWDDYWYEYLGRFKGTIGKMVERITAKLPNHIISISEKVTGEVIKIGVEGSRITTIPIGIDLEEMQAIEIQKCDQKIIFAGRLIMEKHVDWLIQSMPEVLRKLPDAYLVIVGDGPEKQSLKRLVNELKLDNKVIFLGAKGPKDTLKEIKSSKILVLPSTREGQGLVILEAMAGNTSVIAVGAEGSAVGNLIKNGYNGILVDPGDTKTLSMKIIELFLNNEMYENLTRNGMKMAQRFDWNMSIIPETMNIYEGVRK